MNYAGAAYGMPSLGQRDATAPPETLPSDPLTPASWDGNAFANVPLHFEPNLGQADGGVVFTARTSMYTLLLAATEAAFIVAVPVKAAAFESDAEADASLPPLPHHALPDPPLASQDLPAHRIIRLQFVDSNPAPKITGLDRLPGISNCFRGNDPAKWVTDVPHHARVLLKNVWPGVDVVFYGTPERTVQYDFVVHAGGDPAAVRLSFDGARISLDDDGALLLDAGAAGMKQLPPFTYQHHGDARVEVASQFDLLPDGTVGFEIGSYDPARPLIIDPVALGYSTYLGEGGWDVGQDVTIDGDGNAYVTGRTTSTDFPVVNAYQSSYAGGMDAFVTKFTPAGGVAYSTYLGGTGEDRGWGIAVDADGSAYVTGEASSNFPRTSGAYQPPFGGGGAFVTKLTPQGNALAYGAVIQGSFGHAIAVDASGSAYVTGRAWSSVFPTTQGAYQSSYAGNGDAFVTKLSSQGNALAYSTYLGGDSEDRGWGVAVDAGGNAYLTGGTRSTDACQGCVGFPTTPNAFQVDKPSSGGIFSAFVTKLAATGDALDYSTHLGGGWTGGNNYGDEALGIAVDAHGNAHVTGFTRSFSFPVENAFQPTRAGGEFDAFVSKLVCCPPSAPKNLTAQTGPGAGEISLAWQAPSNGGDPPVTQYRVYRSVTSGSPYALVATLPATTLAYTDSNLGNGVTRYYVVRAANDDDEGPASDEASATTGTLPSAPLNLTAQTGPGAGEITLAWQPPASNGNLLLAHYRVYRSLQSGGPYVQVGSTNADEQTFTDINLQLGQLYYYRVSAVNDAGEGPMSEEAWSTPLPVDIPEDPSPQDDAGTRGDVPGAPVAEPSRVWVEPGVVYQGNTTGALGDVADWCAFNGTANAELHLRTAGTVFCVWSLHDVNGSPLDRECAFDVLPLIQYRATLPESGVYFLRVVGSPAQTPFHYRFAFELNGEAPDPVR